MKIQEDNFWLMTQGLSNYYTALTSEITELGAEDDETWVPYITIKNRHKDLFIAMFSFAFDNMSESVVKDEVDKTLLFTRINEYENILMSDLKSQNDNSKFVAAHQDLEMFRDRLSFE